MAYCRRLQTDGEIPTKALKQFKSYRASRAKELMTAWDSNGDAHRAKANPLWIPIHDIGVKVHDYLQWNLSREEEEKTRVNGARRVKALRGARTTIGAPPTTAESCNALHPPLQPSHDRVLLQERDKDPDRNSDLRSTEKVPIAREAPVVTAGRPTLESDVVAERAASLVYRYGELYLLHRRGAKYRPRPNLDWLEACDLVKHWDDSRLEKLAVLVLTTDDDWISRTDRSFKIFALKATWADDKLRAWEDAHGVGS